MRPVERDSEYSIVLRYIHSAEESLTFSQIVESTGISQKNVSRILNYLFNERLIKREGKKRSYRYSVNESAKDEFSQRL